MSSKLVPDKQNKQPAKALTTQGQLPSGLSLQQLLGGQSQVLKYSYTGAPDEHQLPKSSYIVWVVLLMFLSFFTWAYFAELDEVANGSGKVIPSSKEQFVQSLEGGILKELLVTEGELVEAGQILARLDEIKMSAAVEESDSRRRAAQAESARLYAEVNDLPLVFPEDLLLYVNLIETETAIYYSRKKALAEDLANIDKTLDIVQRELSMTERLTKTGAASDVEVLRLRRQINELKREQDEKRNDYKVRAREALSRANAEVEAQNSITLGRNDALRRLTLRSPVRGIVKDIKVTTIGGVLPQDGKIMEVVPVDEKLLVEAHISPSDIAFIHLGLEATVKITAYDYAIYGGLKGVVDVISPDTIQDDVKRDVYYYRVYIRTHEDHLTNKQGKTFAITPGMITTVDIHTGKKTVFEYLVKPFNRAREALRER